MAGESKTTFSLRFDSKPEDIAASRKEIEGFREAMSRSDAIIKDATNSLKRLTGKSADVVAARTKLKAMIASEKDVMSKNSLSLAKLGTTFEKATKSSQEHASKLKDEQKKLTDAFNPLTSKLGIFGDLMKGTASSEALLAAGMAGLAAAAAAVTVALVAGVAMLSKWALGAANAARNLGLIRESATGSAKDAENLGYHIDELTKKVPLSESALTDMSTGMIKAGLSGQTLVDSMRAVAEASAGLSDEAGNKVRDFIERSKLTKRFSLGALEMQGTGIQRDDVAKQLAKNLKTSIGDARQALAEGRVKLDDGAKALADALESRFGAVNQKKLLSFENLSQTFSKNIADLAKGINLEPLLEGFQEIVGLFSQSSESGAALKDMVTLLGNSLSQAGKDGAPLVKNILRGMIIAGLDIAIAFYKTKNALKETFSSSVIKNVDWLGIALTTGKVIMYSIAAAVALVGVAVAAVISPFVNFAISIDDAIKKGRSLIAWFKEIDWSATGSAIVDGLVNGIKNGTDKLITGVKNLAGSAKDTFKKALGIASPSKVFAEFGKHTADGYAQGVDKSAGTANDAVASMVDVPQPSKGGAQGAGAVGGLSVTIAPGAVVVHVGGGGENLTPQAVAGAISDENFFAKLAKALQDAVLAAAVPAGG